MSAKFRPIARVRTSACPDSGRGSGTSRHWRTSGPPKASNTSACISVSQDAQFVPDADEGFDCTVQMLARVRSRQLRADARLAFGHDREEETDRVDAFLEQALGELLRERRVVQHHRADRMHAGLDV